MFCKKKTAYEMRISDWSSDVCSSDLRTQCGFRRPPQQCGEPASQGREAREGDGTKGGRPEARVAEQSSAGRDRNRDAHSANAGGACACLRAARAHVTPPYFSFPRSLFAAKLFIAGMLAFALAVKIGLPQPSWALVTCCVVMNPITGDIRSKAIYRFMGPLGVGVVSLVLADGK